MRLGYIMQQGPDIRQSASDGPASHVLNVINQLWNLGHHVDVLLGLEEAIWASTYPDEFRQVALRSLERGPRRWLESVARRVQRELGLPYVNFFDSRRFAAACSEKLAQVDLLFERLSWTGFGGAMAARRLGVPLILEYNGDPLHDLENMGIAPQGAQRFLSSRLMRAALHSAAHVIATGNGWRDQAVAKWGLDPDKVTTVENGTSLVETLDRNGLRCFQESEGQSSELTLVYLGGFHPWQGVSILIEAFDHLIRQHQQLKLLMIGAGTGLEVARRQVAERLLSDRVTFTGALSSREFGSLLAGADIGVSPYCGWSEYSGLKLYDYKAAGLAVIASGEAGEPVALDHGRSGWIVPPCDAEELVQAILRLATDADLRRGLGRQARYEAEQKHGWDKTALDLERVFMQVAGTKRGDSDCDNSNVRM